MATVATTPAAESTVEAVAMDLDDEPVSPKNIKTATTMEHPMHQTLDSLGSGSLGDLRADPDAQATVTDFLDFTEYLPSDMMRSLTLIGKLDETHVEASDAVDDLTRLWGKLPTLPGPERPDPVKLRAEISENLGRLVSSRVFSHAEALRMSENLNRHLNRARTIRAKLATMLENYPPPDEVKSPVAAAKSPQLLRAPKVTIRVGGDNANPKVRRQRVPRITVPGEVLAPYEVDYDDYSDDSSSSSSSSDSDTASRKTPAPRIKIVTKKEKSRSTILPPVPPASAIVYPPPPDDAVIGSPDLPWMQLLPYEMVRLRKRMKKNPTWEPSQSMILRELEALGRGPTAFKAAEQQAKDEDREFDGVVPEPTIDPATGEKKYPIGCLNQEALEAEGIKKTNRGMKLNEFKKHKKELAKIAAEEAEESARKMAEAARMFERGFLNGGSTPSIASSIPDSSKPTTSKSKSKSSSSSQKRKRDDGTEAEADAPEGSDTPTPKPPAKRNKTETPVPPPQHGTPVDDKSRLRVETPVPPPVTPKQHSTTPVPIPIPGQPAAEPTIVAAAAKPASLSPGNSSVNNSTVTTTVPTKPPAETPILPPVPSPMKSITPIPLPIPQSSKRETRQDAAKKTQQPAPSEKAAATTPVPSTIAAPLTRPSSSRGVTPRTTPGPDAVQASQALRPRSRGKAMSQEPPPTMSSSVAADRPRRASTARNTPAPETRAPSKRGKRPAPGVVSTTSSGGNSAVGKRKAAPKKKARTGAQKKEPEMEEVDDEGNPIDPDEARYCLCNRVSFGTMIQCDNMDNCEKEWFHLECVGLEDIPARTTKWYCPECRVLLKIGEKGEVNSRGVKM